MDRHGLARLRPGMAGCALILVVGAGCASSTPDAVPAAESWPRMSTSDYLPGVAADVHLPPADTDGPVPVVLLVPGGGWQSADRTGLSPLAARMADAGMLVVNATYRVGGADAQFPLPVQDVICAADFAAEQARVNELDPGPLVVVGHSAGGHLAALAALGGDELAGQCPYRSTTIDGLVGLAGVYDVTSFGWLDEFFGVPQDQDPELWRRGDPLALVGSAAFPEDLQVLLLHGDADVTVPISQSEAFAEALAEAGVPVQFDVLPGITHDTVYTAEVAAEPLITWIGRLQP